MCREFKNKVEKAMPCFTSQDYAKIATVLWRTEQFLTLSMDLTNWDGGVTCFS